MGLLFMENEHYALVDALPYIDTQLGQAEVAQQVKELIEQEMGHFEPREYLASLPAPELPLLDGPLFEQDFARVEAGQTMNGIDINRYKVTAPEGTLAQDFAEWKKAAECIQMQLEYNRLRTTNLEMLERWGAKAWIAHSCTVRSCERVLTNEASGLRSSREDVNKKRKLDQVSCGNELRKLSIEFDQYQRDNIEVQNALYGVEAEVQRLKAIAKERGVEINDITGDVKKEDNITILYGDGSGDISKAKKLKPEDQDEEPKALKAEAEHNEPKALKAEAENEEPKKSGAKNEDPKK